MSDKTAPLSSPSVILSFKKFLIGHRAESTEMTNEALAELASYSQEEIKALGNALKEREKEAKEAEEKGTLDELCEKYAAEIQAAIKEKKNEDG